MNRRISNDDDPAPMIIAARKTVTGTDPAPSTRLHLAT